MVPAAEVPQAGTMPPGDGGTSTVAPAPAPPPLPWIDPALGMTEDGVIPRVPRPPGIDHPERWRYVPPARTQGGNIFQRFLITSFIGPYAYYTPEVGFGVGVAVTDTDFRQEHRQENAAITAERSTLGQEQYTIDWQRYLGLTPLPNGGVFFEERSWVRLDAGYDRVLTRRFYGFGPDTPDANQTSYTDEASFAGVAWQQSLPRIGDDLVLQAGLQWQHHNLAHGHASGVPSTDAVYPALTQPVDGNDAGWVTVGAAWDTRDSQHNPYRGWVAGLTLDAAPLSTSGHAGGIVTARTSAVLPVAGIFHGPGYRWEEDPPTDVLAVGVLVAGTYGRLPFFDLPSLGGSDTLRAYIADRFTDRDAWSASAEYRCWVIPRGYYLTILHRRIGIERFGLAPFVDTGSVAPTPAGLVHARPHASVGLGFRAMVERASLFRADLAFWRHESAVTGGYGLSF